MSERNGAGKLEAAQESQDEESRGAGSGSQREDGCWPRAVTKPVNRQQGRWNKEKEM